uniref:Uncharacterized protein n=1 Tax=Dunaliella tertiolecta TaxID=3047 RepID=A0A7S3QS02_DUNTE
MLHAWPAHTRACYNLKIQTCFFVYNPQFELQATWAASHVYAHKSNHMWRLLKQTGIAPPETTGPEADDTMPHSVGVGFTDVGTGHPGTKSSDFPTQVFLRWREDFYERMRAHMRAASESIGCSCGSCGAPALVAFSGKRHYMELLNAGRRGKSKIPKVEIGVQPANLLPPGWPFPASTQVIVCCSTSGASPMTAAERLAPYQDLASKLAGVPWPRADLPRCKVKEAAG